MRICLDIQAAMTQRAGVGRYTQMLAQHLAGLVGPADDLLLFHLDFRRRGIPFDIAGARQRCIRWCPGRFMQKAWKTIGWPPFDRLSGAADVYHFPNFILPPLRQGKGIVTIHDVAFLRHPETTEPRNLRYLQRCMKRTVQQADAIITVSAFSGQEVAELLDVPTDRIHPVPLGLDERWTPSPSGQVRQMREELGLERPYILTVGTLEPRKNLPFLVNVFDELDFDGDLVVVGMKGWKYEPILAALNGAKRAARIRYMDYVDDAWLPALYTGAELFAFPSLYEGFGFTPLEAMACGTPVVSSAGGSLPEVLGDAALMVEAFDRDAWREAMGSLLSSPERCEQYRRAGRQRAERYNWERTARETWGVYQQVAS